MRKKVKLFALEKRPYERLFQMFKDNYVEIRVSYCVNRYLKEFLFNKIVNTGMIYANNRIVPFLSKSLLPTCIKRITQRQGGGFAGVLLRLKKPTKRPAKSVCESELVLIAFPV